MSFIKLFLSNYMVWTLIIVVKLHVLRSHIFPESHPKDTLALETSTILIFFSLIEMIFKRGTLFLYLSADMVLSTVFLAIILYYSQFGRIITHYALYQVGLIDDIGNSISALFDYRYVFFYIDLVLALFFIIIGHYPLESSTGLQTQQLSIIILLSAGISLFNIYTHKEDKINITRLAQKAGILNAEGFQFFTDFKRGLTNPRVDVSTVRIDELKDIKKSLKPKYFGIAKDKNLIVIQLESIQSFPLGLTVSEQEITPNLNKLANNSLFFSHFYSQIGQGSTSDAEFAVNTSIYPLENGAVTSLYKNKDFPGLPKLLKTAGYRSLTFHANKDTFWNRYKIYPSLGFDKYYALDFFGQHDLIDMGPSDEYFFQRSIPVLVEQNRQNQKFYANFVTLTSHHPFIIPDGRTELILPTDLERTLLGNYLNAANYVDKALGEFFNYLKRDGLWDNSVIVIYGDHFGLTPTSLKQEGKEQFWKLLGKEYDYLDMFNVPLIIRVPGINHQSINLVGGQVDILPTLTNLFGISSSDSIYFGKDLLNNDANLIGIRYFLPEGSFVNNEELYISDIAQAEIITTREKSAGGAIHIEQKKRILELERLSDAYLKSLPERRL